MPADFTNAKLDAFLDEALPPAQMAAIEDALRQSDELQQQLVAINGRRDAGVHSLGEVWRRYRLSCPSRQELGSYLLGVLSRDAASYVQFHLETIECRYCVASVADLQAQHAASDAEVTQRRRQKFFQSSAGYLRRK